MLFFEHQAFLNLADAGTTTTSVTDTGRFERASGREKNSLRRCPPRNDETDGQTARTNPTQHSGVEVILDEVREHGSIREPMSAAIDITPWPFYASPYKDDEDMSNTDTSVIINGRERYPREDYPAMVNGLKNHHERGYQLATITIIAEDTPIVLSVEPVRRESIWETNEVGDTSNERIVNCLLKQAEQHVAIHKLFCDRGFDAAGVRDAIDRHEMTYLIPKRVYLASEELADIEELEREAVFSPGRGTHASVEPISVATGASTTWT